MKKSRRFHEGKLRENSYFRFFFEFAVDSGAVTDDCAVDHVDDVFINVGGVVADAFQVTRDIQEIEVAFDVFGVLMHKSEELGVVLPVHLVDDVVVGESGGGKIGVEPDEGVEALAERVFRALAEGTQVDGHLRRRDGVEGERALCDVHGEVADALQVVVHLEAGDDVLNVLIVLPERTYATDASGIPLPPEKRVEIEL